MSEVYIRSQNKEQLYVFGISFNAVGYNEGYNSKAKKGTPEALRHTICISDGCLEKIGEYATKERCIEVLEEIQKVCGSYLYAAGNTGLMIGSEPTPPMAAVVPRLYNMPLE